MEIKPEVEKTMESSPSTPETIVTLRNDGKDDKQQEISKCEPLDLTLQYDDDAVISRIFQLEDPVLYENMLPYLYAKKHLDRILEYLIKDYIRKDGEKGNGSEFTDRRCAKMGEFLTSNVDYLKTLLLQTKHYIVHVVFSVFIHNNLRNTANIYELSLFIRFLLVMLPDQILPYVRGDDICCMLMQLKSNRVVYDILVLLLSYPEKIKESEMEKLQVDEDEDKKPADVRDCYNVTIGVLRKHIRMLYQIHILPTMLVVITDESSDVEVCDLLCNLLSDVLYKYSYNEKYIHLIRDLRNDDLIHRLITFIKTHPNPYLLKLIERVLYLLSVSEIAVAPDNYIRFGLLVDDYMDNEFMQIAPDLYNSISLYVLFLIKQLYRHLPSPGHLITALDSRYHLIDSFQLGDISRTNTSRANDNLHIGTRPIHLLRIIYYIILGFSCKHGENLNIITDVPNLFWNLLYSLPMIYPQMNILHTVIRQFHSMFIFNRVNSVLIHVISNTPFTQYCIEEYKKRSSTIRGHIRFMLHQLRLRVAFIEMSEEKTEEEKKLVDIVKKDYYYQRLQPLLVCDSIRELYVERRKKVLQSGMMKHVLECSDETLLKEATTSKCLDFGSEFAKKLGFQYM